ncbi:bacterial transcriptional activator domain-containing protein [Brevibacillus parabrevis]|uniref:bacterial transcriptional activator domain-containing protein n=1 Tax=Brevibacillus parabrevis TaxID=54914 RepID=UPI002E246474|nr:bacterial transcriptional activator domain-containing protein [Brevibacillus parabrevis]
MCRGNQKCSQYIRALRRMYRLFRMGGNAVLAAGSLQRILAIAPESETDGRELIELHLEAGNCNEALRVYWQLEQFIRDELGVAMEEEAVRLYQQMRHQG